MTNNMLDQALTLLLLKAPFFGALALKIPIVEDDTINPPTACVGMDKLRYHPKFVEPLTVDERVFLLAHEVGHMALVHLPRLQQYVADGIGPDGKPLNGRRFNQAMDYIVNKMLVDEKIGSMIAGGCLDMTIDLRTDTPESIYCRLQEKGDDDGDDGDGEPGGTPSGGFDGHDPGKYGDKPLITADDVEAAVAASKMIGKAAPSVIQRVLGDLKRPHYNPWRMLRAAVATARGRQDISTWKRLNRRMLTRGIGMPSCVSAGADTVGIIIDVSGSINEEMLRLFGGHMVSILETAKPRRTIVYWVDTQVERVDVVHSMSDLTKILTGTIPGGGGTNLLPGIDAAEADHVDSLVILTDGYCNFGGPRKGKAQVIWAITTPGITCPWGTTVSITEK